ncbi:acyl-CoA dehydrogenase family protein [Microvirga vignae]|uniref:acyl-CoA dehydrogenase family protein n=1 Tax=Microvirga vignae TaxID=1225564 RepID=UPI00069C8ACB|nr:acyl-CoA dehydrogenase [Microvirga vignae]
MDFTLTEEQTLLRDSARRYFAKSTDLASPRIDSGKVWTDIAEMGWLAVMIPMDLSGFGGSIVDGCLLMRELGRAHVGIPFAQAAILGARTFLKDPHMLEQIAEGKAKLAYVLQDDAADPLRFEKSTHGYTLRGAKPFISCCSDTSTIIVKAFDGTGTIPAVFRLPKELPLLNLNSYSTLDGVGAASVVFDALEISGDACLAVGEAAQDVVEELELAACLAFSAEAVGLMEFLVNATREYTETRMQFGQKISGFQVVRHKVVEMYALSQLAGSLVFQAADTFDRLGRTAETRQAVRAAFSYVGRQGRRVGKDAIQLHGAIGTMNELPIGHAFARLVAISQSCGGASMHEINYAEQCMTVGDTSRVWAL